jgi:hypothetical protein
MYGSNGVCLNSLVQIPQEKVLKHPTICVAWMQDSVGSVTAGNAREELGLVAALLQPLCFVISLLYG